MSAILAPFVVGGEYLLLRVILPAQNAAAAVPLSTPIPAPFVDPGIIVVQPPETETQTVIPDTQRRPTGKHRAPEVTPSQIPVPPRGDRRVAPVDPTTSALPPTGSTAATTPPPAATTTPPPTSSTISSTTPVYDTLRSETVASDPNLETVIPE